MGRSIWAKGKIAWTEAKGFVLRSSTRGHEQSDPAWVAIWDGRMWRDAAGFLALTQLLLNGGQGQENVARLLFRPVCSF